MVLNQLKQIRDELKNSADVYDRAFKNTALIAAQELAESTVRDSKHQEPNILSVGNTKDDQPSLKPQLNKDYFLKKYGSLKNAKQAYQKIYGDCKYGRSWSEFITVAQKLAEQQSVKDESSLAAKIAKIEAFLQTLGYEP